jgi:hypothetical protein
MYSLLYASSASSNLSKEDLLEILVTSRQNNERLGITGLLLYKDGNIMQALEGERTAVEQVYAKIVQDPRHHGLLKLLARDIERREFGEWSMGFRDLNAAASQDVPGYSEFLNTPLTDPRLTSNPSLCYKLLLSFKRTM